MIYLDNNATTPVDPEVADAVFSSLRRDMGNPSSAHAAGNKAKEALEASRETVAGCLECSADEIIFTSGGTESNNLAITGLSLERQGGHIITSVIEHPSVLKPCDRLTSRGFDVSFVPVDGDGVVDTHALRRMIRRDTFLISVMHANNETGVLQPIDIIGAIAREKGVPFHVDAAQSLGKIRFSLRNAPIDLLTIVPHKFYGPKGIGALFVRTGVSLHPILYGANHEKGIRPGTENVPGIAGLAKACEIAERDIDMRVTHTGRLRDLMMKRLGQAVTPVRLNGSAADRLPNTLNVSIRGVRSHDLVERLKDRVMISSGSACHEGKQSPSHVLKSMGLADDEALSAIRISIGKDNTEEEIETAADLIAGEAENLHHTPGTAR